MQHKKLSFSKCTDTIFQVHRYHLKLSWAFPSTQILCWPEMGFSKYTDTILNWAGLFQVHRYYVDLNWTLWALLTVTEGTYCWCWAVSECVDLYKATSPIFLLFHWLMKCLFLCWNVDQISIASMASTDAACLWSVRNPCNTPHKHWPLA